MTHFVNPKEIGVDLVPYLVNMTKSGTDQIGGADYTFDCTGRSCARRWKPVTAAGARASSLGSPAPARRFRPDHSSSSPAGFGGDPLSAAPGAVPMCPRSLTGTWKARSRSTP